MLSRPSKYVDEIRAALRAAETHPWLSHIKSAPRFGDLETYLEQLLDVCFIASLFRDEGRKVSFSVAFVDWNNVQAAGGRELLVFDAPQRFEPKILAKLAPAASLDHVYIMVDTDVNRDLTVRGLYYDLGARRTEVESTRFAAILVRVLDPGVIELDVLMHIVARYDKGKLLLGQHQYLRLQQIQPVTAPLMDAHHVLGLARHILRLGHGGALFILGNSDAASCKGNSWLEMRYPCTESPFSILRHRKDLEPKEPPFYNLDYEREYAHVANLTAVDGGVLMSSDLDVVAYGVFVRSLADEEELRERGTRHKSAVSFCRQWANALAVVVSQDGDATLFARKDGIDVPPITQLLP